MLILSRKCEEQIMIADNIVVTVLEIRGDKVRLGIEAPREMPVHRREIHDLIQREKSQQPDGASTGTATGQSE
ncbi:MAG: carbon storage regulator CsrA [Planctomycetes bacterium]|nr:carbon storage regulator CsrA [Planctomycetota bacterium]